MFDSMPSNLSTDAPDDSTPAEGFSCTTRAHTFLFWDWFLSATQAAEMRIAAFNDSSSDDHHDDGDYDFHDQVIDLGFAGIGSIWSAVVNEILNETWCYDGNLSVRNGGENPRQAGEGRQAQSPAVRAGGWLGGVADGGQRCCSDRLGWR